ncbi:MAG: Nucleoside diphosphate kinase [Candidatus Woesebacteria bacterium GW2011_GWD1_41_12]|uniref:Nucleoside diphosphate kinase n=5 Tax=Candidatus Woeseibacteriota TaxID=1752722 RepID=A0A0G0X0G2_9BACT|nr:MAG: Nucleoside diphosphate kinase [Candidatus Woesebacteria bacterium GW2011_GWD1_41_12]KKS18505.1 MAG: Nucleoside diphosphate kinase [Candidatus Woesebacteria bacterium GW2011_GWA1_41_7]OGM80817.1 MAG: nucleoside-diphosphate kinase [Candidatus Woesebacteria bacterium RIFOXYB1_FULL_41_13]OGM88861.1 MAG: nucleoside-diphosphate kinase [Candidatus Woesebacteria bacterium RIFOXYD1_FULL_41_28]
MERTIVLIKPDGLQRGLVGEIMHRFERKGLKLVGVKMIRLTDDILENWYSHHKDKPFFATLKSFMEWTPVVAMVWEGVEAIAAVRKIVGITKAREAEAGSIRGDFGMSGSQNIIHASDSSESAEKELGLIFNGDEIFDYDSATDLLIYSKEEVGK